VTVFAVTCHLAFEGTKWGPLLDRLRSMTGGKKAAGLPEKTGSEANSGAQ
jgi:hypothetical protein